MSLLILRYINWTIEYDLVDDKSESRKKLIFQSDTDKTYIYINFHFIRFLVTTTSNLCKTPANQHRSFYPYVTFQLQNKNEKIIKVNSKPHFSQLLNSVYDEKISY